MVDCLLAHAFVDDDGAFGNPVLVVIEPDGGGLPQDRRQALADRLGIPAVAFVRSAPARRTEIAIHGSYGLPIRFGGHPVLGTHSPFSTGGRCGSCTAGARSSAPPRPVTGWSNSVGGAWCGRRTRK
ncbi:hypothetical protein [Streptomyces chrestomyceticus]|uniref:hypothetical protein n=1 Tax=Streptomyces chrestomyceticus TaxID=68185 RepID=UPI00378EDD2D